MSSSLISGPRSGQPPAFPSAPSATRPGSDPAPPAAAARPQGDSLQLSPRAQALLAALDGTGPVEPPTDPAAGVGVSLAAVAGRSAGSAPTLDGLIDKYHAMADTLEAAGHLEDAGRVRGIAASLRHLAPPRG